MSALDAVLRTPSAAMPKEVPRVADYQRQAAEIIPRPLYEAMFTDADLTTQNNRDAFARVKLQPRVLVDVAHRRLATTVQGHDVALPVLLAPVGMHMRVHPEGELASARAAAEAGTVLTVSHVSSCSLEQVAAASGPLWLQLYPLTDRSIVARTIRRAEEAGYRAIVVTVDVPAVRSSEREDNFARALPPDRRVTNLDAEALAALSVDGEPPARWDVAWHDAAATWEYLEWMRSITALPLIVKGVMHPDDARMCVEVGAAGLVVSNHGGHAVEDAVGTLDVLPAIADEAGAALEVYLDGGVRTGTDVLKALAFGARAVLVGRALFWGLAVDGAAGLRRELAALAYELDTAMAYCGVQDVNAVPRSLVTSPFRAGGAAR